MAELLALSNGSKDETSASKILRDKAYTLLTNHMSTIRIAEIPAHGSFGGFAHTGDISMVKIAYI